MVDPDGELAFVPILIAAAIGGGLNLGIHALQGNIDNFWDGAMAFGVGTVAGAAGGAAGQAVAGVVGTVGFAGGALTGAASGAAGGFVGGAGNAWADGASFGQGLKAGAIGGGFGALTGGLIGGVSGGIKAIRHGGDFWSGKGATFASHASGAPIAGEKIEYSTNSAREFSEKHFKDLKYYDNVELHADGTTGSKLYKRSGDWFIEKATQKKVYALHQYLGTGKGSEIHFAAASFTSSRQLYLIMGHEYIHAGYYLGYDNAYNHGNVDKQHAAIYRWEQAVSRRWGNWSPGTGTHQWKHLYNDNYDYEKFFKISIPWID